jgi:hypothetical protein
VRNLPRRVPWHDQAWNGHVCSDPLANSSCLALKTIAGRRRDQFEATDDGESWKADHQDLPTQRHMTDQQKSPAGDRLG